MRLLTHNMLSCNIKGITNGFPLRLEVEKFVEKEVDFNPDFLKNMFVKIEWKALVNSARSMNYVELPEEADSSLLDSEDFLKKFHHALLELHLEEGALICPETGRRFPVSKGIPNMLLHEDEVPVDAIHYYCTVRYHYQVDREISSQKKKTGGIASKRFLQRVKKQNELFRSNIQQDAHEFLNFLLNELIDILAESQDSKIPPETS